MNLNIIRDKEQIYQVIKACDTAFEEPVIGSCSFDLLFSKICNYAIFIEACANDSPLGYAAMYANDIKSRVAYLTLIAVRPDYQNMGIGSALLAKCVCCAKDYNMKLLRLEVRKRNANAISFYKKNGFVIEKECSDISFYMLRKLE